MAIRGNPGRTAVQARIWDQRGYSRHRLASIGVLPRSHLSKGAALPPPKSPGEVLKLPGIGKTEVIIVAEDDVIEHSNPQNSAGSA
jgi:hypothetical protein